MESCYSAQAGLEVLNLRNLPALSQKPHVAGTISVCYNVARITCHKSGNLTSSESSSLIISTSKRLNIKVASDQTIYKARTMEF
jgi:hypothetical protein